MALFCNREQSRQQQGQQSIDEWVTVDVADETGADGAPRDAVGLSAEAVLEREVAGSAKCRLRAVLSVLAPTASQDGRRAPLRLVAVLDRSGSMRGEKIRLVMETVVFMLKKLQATDALGIVDYGTDYRELCPLTLCDDAGKAYLEKAVKGLQVSGQTNLSGGLLMGLGAHAGNPRSQAAAAAQASAPEDGLEVVRSTFLFTDGLANVGMQRTQDIQQAVQSKLSELPSRRSSINTFGFGDDHNAEMLKGIADAGEGTYTHVQGEDNIGEAFGAALGGLISTTHQNVQLSLQLSKGVSFAEPDAFFTKLRVSSLDLQARKATVEVGDLFAEERRDVLVELALDEAESGGPQSVARLTATGFSVIDKRTEAPTKELSVARRTGAPCEGGAHELVAREWNRHVFNEAMARGTEEAERHDVGRAREWLQEAGRAIEASNLAQGGGDAVSRGLVLDLNDCLRDLGTADSYRKAGSKKMHMMTLAHVKQRGPPGVDLNCDFATPAQSAMRADFKKSTSLRMPTTIDSA